VKTYWCRYEVDPSIPGNHMLTAWPKGMKGWVGGYTGDEPPTAIWCARVDAESAEDADRIVRSCYTKSGDKIVMSWEPQEHELGWRPTGGRFPE
jgi:hypothetical protein